jgi:hypothetical protein
MKGGNKKSVSPEYNPLNPQLTNVIKIGEFKKKDDCYSLMTSKDTKKFVLYSSVQRLKQFHDIADIIY